MFPRLRYVEDRDAMLATILKDVQGILPAWVKKKSFISCGTLRAIRTATQTMKTAVQCIAKATVNTSVIEIGLHDTSSKHWFYAG